MKALIIGSGAREHAIADALASSGSELYGFLSNRNPGIYRQCMEFTVGSVTDAQSIKKFAEKTRPDLAVIGPEAPLEAGVADELLKIGIACFGPSKALAQLETSKSFTRQLLEKYRIPGNPKYRIFGNKSSESEIKDFMNELGKFVVKPDGLTGGKGVKVSGEHLQSSEDAVAYCNDILRTHSNVIVEEKLDGEEFSLQSITDAETVVDCPPVQDHKRAYENDEGQNTGGMGSYSDSNHLLPFLKREHVEQAHEITEKTAKALKQEIGTYRGVMYGGFMLTKKGVKLIEYNARFGDPEAMNVLPLLKTSFAEICRAAAEGELRKAKAEFERKATVCKYVVPKGYPENPVTGRIDIPEKTRALRFYAAVREQDGIIYTTRSRAAAFVGIADTIENAERIAEQAACMVRGETYHRRDIGTRQLLQKRVQHMASLK
ncbi:phosphoribosylamine--glycine ligase [Candidatus Woesearchaeota archaeon]|nr:phosphoribosylamine--glycine ligase [Candidatus Woesearchaeota archaeon]